MSCFLSHSRICGDSRGISGFFNLLHFTESTESHLASAHLSRENIMEGELILARAGLSYLEQTVVEQMSVCSKHKHTFGKFWCPKTACQYPAHQKKKKKILYHLPKILLGPVHFCVLFSCNSRWPPRHGDALFAKQYFSQLLRI